MLRSDKIVILQDIKAAVCLIRRPTGFSNNTFSGFIENVQTDTKKKISFAFKKTLLERMPKEVHLKLPISTTSLPGICTICSVFVVSGLMCRSSGNSV